MKGLFLKNVLVESSGMQCMPQRTLEDCGMCLFRGSCSHFDSQVDATGMGIPQWSCVDEFPKDERSNAPELEND